MHGITDSLRIATSGLQLAQHALSNTSNNVSNVHTEGFSRKSIEQEALVIAGRGVGVREAALTREVDQFLELQLRMQQGSLGRSETIQTYFDDVQGLIFGNPSDSATGLAHFVDDFAAKLEAAAARPEDAASRAALVWSAKDMFEQIGRGADTIQTLRRDADRRVQNLVAEVNTALEAVHKLNLDLKRAGDSPELLDQRDRLVMELSYKLDVRTYTHNDGTIALFTQDGQALLEYQPRVLHYEPASTMDRNTTFSAIRIFDKSLIDPATGEPDPADLAKGTIMVGSGVRADLPPDVTGIAIQPTVTGGELGGLLAIRDQALPEMDDQLAEFGRLLRHALNAAHNDANTLPLANSLAGTRSQAEMDANLGAFAGSAYLQVTDAGGTATVYEIDVAAAAASDDLRAQIALFDPANVTATFNADGELEVTAPAGWTLALANGTSSITQDDAAGHSWDYSFAHYFGLNDLVVDNGDATALAIRDDLDRNPMRIASALLDVTDNAGVLEGELGSVGDNRGLMALAAALETPFQTVARGGLASANVSAREYLGDFINIQALKAHTAERTAETDAILAEELSFQRAGISGVNLDEEMAHLLQLQQAYATSARLVTAADEMLDELLNVRR